MENPNDLFFPSTQLQNDDDQNAFANLNDELFSAVTMQADRPEAVADVAAPAPMASTPYVPIESPAGPDVQTPPSDAVVANLPTAPAVQPESQSFPDMTMTPSPIGGNAYDYPADYYVDESSPTPTGQSVYDANRRLFEGDPAALEQRKQAMMTAITQQSGPTIAKTQLNEKPSVSGIRGTPGNYRMAINGGEVPVDDQTAIKAMSAANDFQLPNNALVRGTAQLNKAMALNLVRVGAKDPSSAMKVIAEINRITPDAPEWLQRQKQEIISQDTFLGSLKAAVKNPVAVLSVIGESIPMSVPSLAAFIGGSAVGTPAGGVAAGGTLTYAVQYSDTILDEMQQAGVDMNDDAAMIAKFTDPDFMDKARERANARGIPIAFFDAMSMGISGKLYAVITKGAPSLAKAAVGGATELGQQSILGGLGEYVAQDLEVRLGYRDKINWGEVNLEAIAEGPTGAIETGVGIANARDQIKANQEYEAAKTWADTQTVVDRMNPQGRQFGFVDGDDQLDAMAPFAEGDVDARRIRLQANVEDEFGERGDRPPAAPYLPGQEPINANDELFSAAAPADTVTAQSLLVNVTTGTHIDTLEQRATEAELLAKQTDQNIENAKGQTLDLDAKRDDEYRVDAENYAKQQRDKAQQLRRQAEELRQFYDTPEGKRYAQAIEDLQARADQEGLDVDIAARLKTVPKVSVDEAISFAAANLEQVRKTAQAKAGNAPPVENKPVTSVAEVLKPLTQNEADGVQQHITPAETERVLAVLNPLIKQLNDMGFETGSALNPANSPQEARDLKSQIIRLAGIYNELGAQRLREAKGYKDFKPEKLARIQREFRDAFIFPDQPAVQAAPAPEPAPVEAPANPQAPVREVMAVAVSESGQPNRKQKTTPDGQVKVTVYPVIVDLSDLKAASGDLQPRDRSLKESDVEVQRRAAALMPQMLMDSPTTDTGAPIIARDGTILSGNGRVMSIRQAYEKFPDRAEEYKQAVASYGRADGANFPNPVLVFKLDDDMTIEQLADFADRSNRSSIAGMSSTERAQRDARAMGAEMVNLYAGGDLTSAENRGFVSQFTRKVVAPNEQNMMSRDGQLTKEGVMRMQNAILAAAYEDTNAIALMLDSTDDNIKAISNSMLAAAPAIAQLKADIEAGVVPADFDISGNITEAAQRISTARKNGVKIGDMLAQQDAFSQMDPSTEALIVAFYNDQGTRPRSQKFMTAVLKNYVEEARQKREGGMFEDNTSRRDVIDFARRKADDTQEGQGSLLAESGPSNRVAPSRESAQRASGTGRSQDSGPRRGARTNKSGQIADAAVSAESLGGAADPVGSTENAVVSLDALDAIENQRTEKPGTLVSKEAERNKTALMFTAFADAGLNPNRAVSLPVRQQIKILSDQMRDRFGMDIRVSDKANPKDARDQLLVGYHQLSVMANAFGLPYKAIGLEGRLTFAIAKNINAYGVYNPNDRTITVPRRVNSFGHEWFHALDHYIFEKYGADIETRVPLQTDQTRTSGKAAFAEDAPVGVRDAYIALVKAMFKDNAIDAAKLAAVEQKISEFEARNIKKDYRNMATWKRLDAQRRRILEGTSKTGRAQRTEFRRDAEFFAGISMSDPSYWTSPREMFARAGEAFISRQMLLQKANADFLAKSQDAYNMTLEDLGITRERLQNPMSQTDLDKIMDSRLALTFPKGGEMMEIFGAFRNLIDAVAAETVLGEGQVGKAPGDEFVIDVRNLHEESAEKAQSILAQQRKAYRERKIFNRRMESRAKEYQKYGGTPYIGGGARKLFEDSFLAPLFYQKKSVIKALIGRYPNSKGLRDLFNRLATDTGGELQSTFEGGNVLDAQMRMTRVFADRLKNIIKKHDMTMFDETEMTQLRMLLTSQDDLGSSSPRVEEAAGDMRLMYDSLYEYLRNSGLDIGYAESGYMQRLLDGVEISADPQGFEAAAQGVYKIVFGNEVGKEFDGSLEQVQEIISFIGEKRMGIAGTDQYQDFTKSSVWQEITGLLRDIKKAEVNNDTTALEAAQAQLDEIVSSPEAQELFETFYNDMESVYSEWSAYAWRTAIAEGQVGDPAVSGAPQSDFRKKRTLPPEADALMEKYYISDPLENLTTYIMGAVRKAEYNRRFGKHLIPKGENKNNKYNDYLDYRLKKIASRDNLLESELNLLQEAVDTMLGRNLSSSASAAAKFANRLSALTSITLLIRAPIASIAEPLTVAMTSGEVSKGASSFIQTLQELPYIRDMSKNTAQSIRERAQFARILGVVDDPEVGDIIANRIGGEFAGDKNMNRYMSSFFHKIRLSGITNAQRRSAARIGFQYLTEVAYDYKNPLNPKMKARSAEIMRDFGVGAGNLEQFVDYLLSINNMKRAKEMKDHFLMREARGAKAEGGLRLPSVEEIMKDDGTYSDMGEQLAVAIGRFADQTIQDPRSSDRPLYAETPVGRFTYGIMAFIYSFQDKVLFAMHRRAKREAKLAKQFDESPKAAYLGHMLRTAAPLGALVSAHFLVSTMREYLLNQERWDREWKEADEDPAKFFTNYLLPLGMSRAGLTGAYDPLYQAFSGLRYSRDISNTMLGTGAYIAGSVQDMASVFINNSPNTLYSEYRFLRGMWNLTVAPLVSMGVAAAPLAPPLAFGTAATGAYVTSPGNRDKVINMILESVYGEGYVRGGKGKTKKTTRPY